MKKFKILSPYILAIIISILVAGFTYPFVGWVTLPMALFVCHKIRGVIPTLIIGAVALTIVLFAVSLFV